jgi:hypothetical protein
MPVVFKLHISACENRSFHQIKKELGMDSDIVPPAILQLLGENFDPAVGTEFDDEEKLPSELEGISTRTPILGIRSLYLIE